MDPSSLIFIVIVAMWLVYLLGHWVRRRDQLAAIRSIDRFSAAMRVLDRRPVPRGRRPGAGGAVSRKTPHHAGAVPTVLVSAKGGLAGGWSRVSTVRVPARRRPVVPQDARRAHRPVVWSARGVVAALLVLLLVAVPVAWVLVVRGIVVWWVAAGCTGALMMVLAGLRGSVRRRRDLARRRAARQRRIAAQARREGRRAVVGGVVAAHRERAAQSTVSDNVGYASDIADTADAGAGEGVEFSDARVAELPDRYREFAGEQWQPVPVPPPTYTMKRQAAVAADAAGEPDAAWSASEPSDGDAAHAVAADAIDLRDDPVRQPSQDEQSAQIFDLDAILERRIAANG